MAMPRRQQRTGGGASSGSPHEFNDLVPLYEALPDGVIVSGSDGRIAHVSGRLAAMTGYSAEELLGRPVETLVPERFREAHRRDREAYSAGPRVRPMAAGHDLVLQRKDGTDLPVDIALGPLQTVEGLFVVGVVRDASERRHAEEQLLEAEARYRGIFENAVEGIFQTGLDGRYLAANPALARMLGYDSPEDLMAGVTDVSQLYVEPVGRDDFVRAVEQHEALAEFEYQVYRKDGSVIWVSEKVRAVRDPLGNLVGFEGTTLDVTERKEAELAVQRRDAILGAVAFAAGRFLSAGSWVEVIDEVLARLGEASGASRVSIYEVQEAEAGRQGANISHEWTAPGIEPQIDNPQFHDIPRGASPVDRWFDVLEAGGLISGTVEAFPEGERPILEAQGVRSLVIAPVFVGGEWSGTISFADCVGERAWPATEIGALRAAADTLGAAISRERAEVALHGAEARYRTLVEQIPAITYITRLDETASAIFMSPQVEALLGYTPEEWVSDPDLWVKVLHPEDRERALAGNRRQIATGEPVCVEYRVIARDGRIVWVREDSVVVGGEPGAPAVSQGVWLDITHRKQAEEELETRARQQALLATLGRRALEGTDLSVLMDETVALVAKTLEVDYAEILELLPTGRDLLLRAGVGWKPGLVGRATVPVGADSQAGYTLLSDEPVVMEDLPTETRFRGPALLRGHGVRSGMSVVIRGRERPLGVLGVHSRRHRKFERVSVDFLQSAANVLAHATERKRAEEDLRDSQANLAEAQRIARLGSWGWDIVENDVWWSDEIYRIFGLTRGEFGETYEAFLASVHPDDRAGVEEAVRAALEERKPYDIEHRIVLPDGTERVVREQGEVTFDATGRPVRMIGTTQDITERIRAEKELKESFELLRKTDAERRRLVTHLVRAQEEERARIAADIHDDPLQKLTAVGMRLGMLRREVGDGSREDFAQLEETVGLTIESLRHLLFEVHPPVLDREGLAAALRLYLRDASQEAGLSSTLDDLMSAEPPQTTRAICYRVAQEALANVRKHARATEVRIVLESRDDGTLVRIHDDGVGFLPDAVPEAPGHLGLPEMRERAESAGGWLRVESSPDAGTDVEFWIPAMVPGS